MQKAKKTGLRNTRQDTLYQKFMFFSAERFFQLLNLEHKKKSHNLTGEKSLNTKTHGFLPFRNRKDGAPKHLRILSFSQTMSDVKLWTIILEETIQCF